MELLAGRPHVLEILARVPLQPQYHRASRRALLEHLPMRAELTADRRPDEVGPIRIEPHLHQQIDMSKIDIPEIDGDLCRFGFPSPGVDRLKLSHLSTI